MKVLNQISFLIFISVLTLSSCNYFFPQLASDKITVTEAYNFLNKHKDDKDVVILDLRTKQEYDSLHIQNSVLIDYSNTGFPDEIEKLDKNKTYIIYDKSGSKSRNTYELMKELGFKDIHIIVGGFDEWKKQNLPLKFNP